MYLNKVFEGTVSTHTPLGSIDLSGYKSYAVLLRLDNAKSDTDDFRFTTYNNSIQVYQHDFKTTSGWHIHNVIHDIFHPKVSFVLYTWNNQANVSLWVYATCCDPADTIKELKVVHPKLELTKIGIIKTIEPK
jgi:hypothetical protein